jgi:hypothetical protein
MDQLPFKTASIFAAVLAVAMGTTGAQAAVVTETYSFTMANFIDVGGPVASPLASISGSFTLTFNPNVYVDNATAGLTVNYLTGPTIASPIGYTNIPSTGPGVPDYLSIGGIQNDADYMVFGTDDFVLSLKFFDPAAAQFGLCSDGYSCGSVPSSTIASGYTLSGYPDSGWLPQAGILTVPEPASWMLLLGASGILAAMRRVSGTRRPA